VALGRACLFPPQCRRGASGVRDRLSDSLRIFDSVGGDPAEGRPPGARHWAKYRAQFSPSLRASAAANRGSRTGCGCAPAFRGSQVSVTDYFANLRVGRNLLTARRRAAMKGFLHGFRVAT
jgi:hypothetical protein